MWIFRFYRMYAALAAGVLTWVLPGRSVWLGLAVAVLVRTAWLLCERSIRRIRLQRAFQEHIGRFRNLYGPYAIRLANKAEKDRRIRESLAEVFTPRISELRKTVEQLDVLDALFQAGMRPQGDDYLLHDLKRKYGKERLSRESPGETGNDT